MKTADAEKQLPKQGPSAEEKKRAQQVSADIAMQRTVQAGHDLTPSDRARMRNYTPGDPVSDYRSHPQVQISIIEEERALAETQADFAMTRAALRAHMPAQAILGIEEPTPAPVDMITPESNIVLGMN